MSETTPDTETVPVSEGARRLGVSEDLYLRRLRTKAWPGRKPGRQWRLTEADIKRALELCASTELAPAADQAGLTRTSRRRIKSPKK